MTPRGRLRSWLGGLTGSAERSRPGVPPAAGGDGSDTTIDLAPKLRPLGETLRYREGELVGGKYRLERALGAGGMGEVWVAQNVVLEAPVALKLLRPENASSASAQRLQREARTAAKLAHPSVVRVFDFGLTERGDPFLVMELLRGESLAQRLKREGPLAPAVAVRLLLPALEGLVAAHERGIVHRDLKPANVFLAVDDAGRVRPKLIDFGIAKADAAERRLTSTGALVGSPEYVSPEQARGTVEVDARSDVWSACVTLYEALAGSTPFDAPDYPSLLWAIVQRPAPRAPVDPPLADIVDRGLRKDPRERWQSAAELGRALASWLLAQGESDDACGTSLRTAWLEADAPVGAAAGRGGLWGAIARLAGRAPAASAPASGAPGPVGAATSRPPPRPSAPDVAPVGPRQPFASSLRPPPHPSAPDVTPAGFRRPFASSQRPPSYPSAPDVAPPDARPAALRSSRPPPRASVPDGARRALESFVSQTAAGRASSAPRALGAPAARAPGGRRGAFAFVAIAAGLGLLALGRRYLGGDAPPRAEAPSGASVTAAVADGPAGATGSARTTAAGAPRPSTAASVPRRSASSGPASAAPRRPEAPPPAPTRP